MCQNLFLSAPKIAAELVEDSKIEMSPENVWRVLKNNNLYERIDRKKPLISSLNKIKQFNFEKGSM